MQITLKELRNLIRTLERGSVREFEYEDEQVRLRLSIGPAGAPPTVSAVGPGAPVLAPDASAAAAAPVDDANVVFVTSPFVGTFYGASNPESEPFVQSGSVITKGQTLCIVEAMKLMNEIESEYSGTVLET